MSRTTKLTISLPQELVAMADQIAKQKKISRSRVISACLQELALKQKMAEMTEGYLKMAKEQKEIAEYATKISSEVLPEWK